MQEHCGVNCTHLRSMEIVGTKLAFVIFLLPLKFFQTSNQELQMQKSLAILALIFFRFS